MLSKYIKINLLLLLVGSLCSTNLSAQCNKLVWSDEFNGSGLPSSTNWGYDLGQNGWGNNEVQNYTNSLTNVRQENGNLIIEAVKSGNTWTSARVKSQARKSFKYGKIVFRAKLPTGVGTWPALWMLGDNIGSVGWPACGEIDIMEHVGKNQNVIQAALHNPSSFGDTQNKGSKTISTASTEFHEYSVSWNAERMIFAVDDIPYYTYKPAVKTAANWPYDANQFIIMNIAMGGNFGGPTIDPALTSAKMEIDYVRVYEERTEPFITGPKFLYENQLNIQYDAPDYGAGVSYTWTAPQDAVITAGQGTKSITVNWGPSDGALQLTLGGETGCAQNSTSINVTTIVEPEGLFYNLENFATSTLPGWSKNDTGITLQAVEEGLLVNFSVNALKYIQYEMPKAIDLTNYGILKIPISVPASSTIPNLLFTFRDGDGNETISTNFEIKISKNDGKPYLYTYNFDGQWALNNPAVNPSFIKYLRIYVLPGAGTYQVGEIKVYNSKTVPTAPTDILAEITGDGEIALTWTDNTNATSFNLYKTTNLETSFAKVKGGIKPSEVPYTIIPTEAISYYKVTGVNANGESPLSDMVEVVANITDTEKPNKHLISVYPNPCTGRFFIQTNGQPIKGLKIFDSMGRVQKVDLMNDGDLLIVDLKTVTSGSYFVFLQQENKSLLAKVIVK